MQQQLIVSPIGNLIEPTRPAVEKQKRKTENQKQDAFQNFEERNQFEVTVLARLLQHCRDMRRITH